MGPRVAVVVLTRVVVAAVTRYRSRTRGMAPAASTRAERSKRTRAGLPRSTEVVVGEGEHSTQDPQDPQDPQNQGAECPVCMNGLSGVGVFAFPCGHCVCNECDAKLRERSFYSCPTCREPRTGMSRAQVDAAATARVQHDQQNDQAEQPWSFLEHHGNLYSVMFLPDESGGTTPFDVLRTVQGQGTLRGRVLGRVVHRPSGQQVIDLTGDDDALDVEIPPVPEHARRAEVALPAALAAMVNEMLQPTHLPDWLRRHDALASMVTGGGGGGGGEARPALPANQARRQARRAM